MSQFKKLLLFSTVLVLFFALCTLVTYADTAKTGTITATSLNLRSGPSTSKAVVVTLKQGTKLTITDTSGSWYKVKTPAGTVGWVSSTYVSTGTSAVASRAATTSRAAISQNIVGYAKGFLGVKYVWGGSSPSGFDCSGFVQYVYNHFGIKIERVASAQAKQGTTVKKSELKAGDLVFFDTDGGHNRVNHVGMYIGNGNFIQASSGKSAHKVVISTLTSGFYADTYMTAKRFF